MSQVSYGTITITDTNDIERIYMEYAQSTSNSVAPTSGWSENIPAWQQGYYIWQRTVTKMQGVSLTSDSYGDPVCLTGSTGNQGPQGNTGVGVSSITTTYCNYGTGTPAATYSGWQTTVPAYDSSKPNYWVKTVVNYNDGTSSTPVIYKDNGITSATSTAAAANQTAGQANQTANQANETANQANATAGNALSVANSANDAISDLNQYFWRQKTAATNVPAGSYVTNVPGTTYKSNPANGGFNSLVQSTGIFLRNGITTLSSWTGSALTFYQPGTSNKGIELTSSALKFYDSTGTTAQATFGGTQATISGTINVYDGKIGNSEDSYWYIGNYLDYNQNNSAAIKSHGTAFIQLGDSSTWRVATNRIHSAWNDDNSTGNAFRLHFPVYENKNSVVKHWDVGMHLPLARTDKFLYIRNADSSQTLENLGNDLEDSGYNYWTYQFWVDGEGNVHAPGFYIGDSTTPIGGGAGTTAQKIINSDNTYGKGSSIKPIYIDTSGYVQESNSTVGSGTKPIYLSSGTITASNSNVGNSTTPIYMVGGTLTALGYTIAKSVPSNAVFTDENVNTSQANTTKIYLTGTSTTGSSTGKLNFDSNVYLTTTAGTLHATTFEGNLSGTASRATADADGNTIKTTYLKLSGGQVTGPVSFGDSVTVEDLVVNGDASFANNISANTINGVSVGSSPKFTDNNTTYTFASGTNGFTVTPSGGSAQTVTVTPSITNNVTGSGTNGSLVKWTGANTIGNGPQIGTGTTKFLREDGTWVVPAGTGVTSVAASGSGGITISGSPITTSGTIAIGLNLSTAINGLGEGTSPATRDDYAVVQYAGGGTTTTSYHRRKLSNVFAALNSSDITTALGYTPYNSTNPNGYTSNTGTVTSVRVQASSPLTSTTNTASSTTLDTTIKFSNQNKNLVLAGPSSGSAAAPTFRSLVAADIPNLSWNKITSDKPTTLSGYGITDAAGTNAIVNLSASSNDAGVTTFTATRASGTNPLSFEVSIVASAATGANALKDSNGLISKGSATKPVYFSNGVPAEANTYAGGTAVTLNNTSKASSTASFYAPTSGGTTAQVLVGNGTTSAPTWKAISDIVPSNATNATNATYATYDSSEASKSTKTTINDKFATKDKYIPYAHYSNTNGSNEGKYYKISINSYTGWMLSFIVHIYHEYKSYDVQISGYNYGSSHWHMPAAVLLGGTGQQIEINFGYDSNYHLWIAIPAKQYTGIDVVYATNGYYQVSSIEDLFTIEMVEGMPTTLQTTKTVYRPWYRDETVTNATNAANATTAATANAVAWSGVTSKPTTISGYGITDAILFGGVDTGLGSGTPAENAKTYYSDTSKVPTNSIKGFLNSSGVEYTTLFSNRGTYGSILKWGYDDCYIRILRNKAGTWQSNDWEKIYAGYADSASSATYGTYIKCPDTRNVALNPEDLAANSIAVRFDFKYKDTIGLTDASYSGVMSFRPYSSTTDWSGGPAHQLAFNEVGLYRRQSTGNTTWGNWYKILDSNNYNSYAPTLTGTGATGTWGISISGKATTAGTADVANKISNITSTDTASSSATWRQVWMSYADGVTGRPAVTSGLTFQTSTNTLKATIFQGALSGTATNANNLLAYSANEVTIGANNATAGSSTNSDIYINYRDVMGGTTNNNSTQVARYLFGNRKGGTTGVTLVAETFSGNATSATKATQDKNGNDITTKYVTIDTPQTITANQKTFNGAIRWSNDSSSKYGAAHYDSNLDAIVFSFAS